MKAFLGCQRDLCSQTLLEAVSSTAAESIIASWNTDQDATKVFPAPVRIGETVQSPITFVSHCAILGQPYFHIS